MDVILLFGINIDLIDDVKLTYIEYGNIFHGTCTEFYKQKLQVIQNNGLKIALNRSRLYNTVDLHIEARLLHVSIGGF